MAQLHTYRVDNDAFAQSKYVEIGINEKGVFGASAKVPSAFHNNRNSTLFGFIANPKRDGWVDYDGDFFTPGDPEEGFGIEIDGENYNNNNNNRFDISGSITNASTVSSNCSAGEASIIWKGKVDGIAMERTYSIAQGGLFIKMTTKLTNQSSATKNNIYFLHTVDPDNNQTISNVYETVNTIMSQGNESNDGVSLVEASQPPKGTSIYPDEDGSVINFYAKDKRSRVTYGGFYNRNASAIYNSTENGVTSTVGASSGLNDLAISIAFSLGNLKPNESVTFTYYYILEPLTDDFNPVSLDITPVQPTNCNGSNGAFLIGGLSSNQPYQISYNFNNTTTTKTAITNENGVVTIDSLPTGTYSNFSINNNGCAISSQDSYILKTEGFPNTFTISSSGIKTCGGNDGTIYLNGFSAQTMYALKYTYNSNPVSQTVTTNDKGNITLSNLSSGNYENFEVYKDNCSVTNTKKVTIKEPKQPVAYDIPSQSVCLENSDTQTVDLSQFDNFILKDQDPKLFEVTYYTSAEALAKGLSANKKVIEISSDEKETPLYAKVENKNTGCYSTTTFNLIINRLPNVILKDQYICAKTKGLLNVDEAPVIDTNLSTNDYSFNWYFNGNLVNDLHDGFFIATQAGNYTVSIQSLKTGCSLEKTVTIKEVELPNDFTIHIDSDDTYQSHSVTIDFNTIDDETYTYQIDNKTPQTHPYFDNVSAGIHTLTVQSLNGCGKTTKEFVILDFPKFFTPNSDGVNDIWKIKGLENYKGSAVYIFDRYGGLIKVLNNPNEGWDGTKNGSPLPSNDYWFKVDLVEDNTVKIYKSHFTLKR
ncbi:T9SS type B sorting domain-containing protein [Zhouia sp. PK063]|uniref:T9SS type B sorting domain-containing protein n=1 Tax=Zhouia sp. PK063 TaxID=3373602 RepID=UPI0037B7BB87